MKTIKRVRAIGYLPVFEDGGFFYAHMRCTRAGANSVVGGDPIIETRIAKVRITEIAPTKKRRKGKGK